MNDAAPPPSPPIKDTIDANSGRFEFLKQTLTLGLAGIGGVAALFTDPSRVPSDTFSKWVLVLAGAGLVFVVAFAVMGLSAYANLLTVSAKISRNTKDVEKYSKGVPVPEDGAQLGLMPRTDDHEQNHPVCSAGDDDRRSLGAPGRRPSSKLGFLDPSPTNWHAAKQR